MTDRPRSDKDKVPDHESGEDALAWMERRLDGSWVSPETGEPRETAIVSDEERNAILDSGKMSMDDFNKLMGF